MSDLDFENITLYDWVPYFMELSNEIAKIGQKSNRDEYLKQKAGECFGIDSSIYSYKYVDPFSFIYFLAQKNTKNQKTPIYQTVKSSFKLTSLIPTDWFFPTPTPNTTSLFHDGINFECATLWNIFLCAVNDQPINDEDFKKALSIRSVKCTKFTQTLFLINPIKFLPIDSRIYSLPLFNKKDYRALCFQIESIGISIYQNFLNIISNNFRSCEFYEINLLGYLFDSGILRINNTYFQIGSNVYGGTNKEKDDYKSNFYAKNSVWVGDEASGGKGTKVYPIFEPKRGDIILSHFNHFGNGIGIVIHNEYARNGSFNDDYVIKVIWLNKTECPNSINSSQMMGFSKAGAIKDSFKEKYSETFTIIEQLITRSGSMQEILSDTIKNIILQGAPGTGKTRLAKQLSLFLQTENSSLSSFLNNNDIIKENNIFTNDPIINKDNEQIQVVQFHPGYTYEDFVRGIISEIDNEGRINYKVKDKILMKIVKKANENLDKKFVIIIDEINRVNLPSVFGELIYALEYRGEQVDGLYIDDETGSSQISIPDNLYIIGTMNTADRTIGHIDYAIRRRFVFKDIISDVDCIVNGEAKELYLKIESLFSKDNLSPEFKKNDVMLGHSYFLNEKRPIKQRLEYEIKPLLREYVKDGILIGEMILDIIENL